MVDKKSNLDILGITASLACAIHCAVLPLVISSLPIFGINIIDNAAFEYLMVALTAIIGCFALIHGFRLHHRRLTPLFLFVSGLLFLVAKQLWHSWQLYLLIPAVLLICGAHYLNYKLNGRSSHQPV